MKTIGLYLGIRPSEGGAHQYNLSIIKSLATLDKNKYKIICFLTDPLWEPLLPKDFKKITIKRSLPRKILKKMFDFFSKTLDGPVKYASLYNPIIKKINKSDCDLVIFPSQDAVAYQSKKPNLTTIHDLMHRYESRFEEYQNGVSHLRDKHFLNICNSKGFILVDSEIGKKHVVESYGKDPARIIVLPFVPPHYLLESKPIDIFSKHHLPERFIFYPAQFWEHKNHIVLLEAVKILKDKGLDINLVLVGSQINNFKKVLSKIDELHISENVFILGYISNDEMASFYRNAAALAFVSLAGPTNIPPLEGMILGCPVIVSNVYAMPEQVNDAALLVDPTDPGDIAEEIEMIWQNESLRKELIERGFHQINKYTQTDFDRILHTAIDKVGDSNPLALPKKI